MLLLAMGPNPTAFGVPFLYEAPYSWLVKLPGFASLRAPARFAMPMALMLAVAAGLAWARIRPSGGRRARWATPALAALIVAESWVAPTAAIAPHPSFAWPEACAGLPRLELPFGDIESGAAVQHRALRDGVRSVNGASGFEPPFVIALQLASERRDTPALVPLARRGPSPSGCRDTPAPPRSLPARPTASFTCPGGRRRSRCPPESRSRCGRRANAGAR
jgi:hypothetical protein